MPYNKLVQKYEAANDKLTSVTITKSFGIKIGDMKIQSFDYSEFNVFLFLIRFIAMIYIYINQKQKILTIININ